MELKKSPKADLQKKKTLFLEIGLAVALGVVLLAVEWTSSASVNTDLAGVQEVAVEEEMIPITNQEQVQQPPAPAPVVAVSDVINIVDDNVDIDDNADIFDSDFDENAAVKIVEFTDTEQEVEEQEVFYVVEDMPGFGDGDSNKFREYIAKNLRYPEVAAENGIQGRVFVQFVVEPDGRVSNVKVIRSVDPALDKEAVRVVESSPKWKPGKQRGKPVRVSFTFPIIFVLQ
jgi:protein TonB